MYIFLERQSFYFPLQNSVDMLKLSSTVIYEIFDLSMIFSPLEKKTFCLKKILNVISLSCFSFVLSVHKFCQWMFKDVVSLIFAFSCDSVFFNHLSVIYVSLTFHYLKLKVFFISIAIEVCELKCLVFIIIIVSKLLS